ncbi:hypothetical protein ACWD1Y_22765 [Streptomyces sp. NPDC002814]
MYTLSALWTQAREQLDITTVILDNKSYAILRAELEGVGGAAGAAAQLFDCRVRIWTSSPSPRAWVCPPPADRGRTRPAVQPCPARTRPSPHRRHAAAPPQLIRRPGPVRSIGDS